MAFTVPVTLTQAGLVSPNTTVTKTTNITQEVVTQIQVVISSGATYSPVNLNILDTSKVNLLVISTTGEITYKFDYTGDDGLLYQAKDIVVLFNDSLRIYDNDSSALPGQLVTMYVNNANSTSVTVNVVIVTSNE